MWLWLARIVTAIFLLFIAFVIFMVVSFKEETITSGEAYGFRIGMSQELASARAEDMLKDGDITEIEQNGSSIKLIVSPRWWSNYILLKFEKQSLTEVQRYRLYQEMP